MEQEKMDEMHLKRMDEIYKEKMFEKHLENLEEQAQQAWYDYFDTHSLPPDIPRDPDIVYADLGWNGWVDWLGWNVPNNPLDIW